MWRSGLISMGTGEGKVAAVPRNAGNGHVKGEAEILCFDCLRVGIFSHCGISLTVITTRLAAAINNHWWNISLKQSFFFFHS